VIPSDGKVLAIEVQQFYGHLRQRYQFQMLSQSQTLAFLNETLTPDQLLQAAKQLPELLSIEDRISLIGMLWDIALCDHELHPFERALIYGVSDHAGVPRKKVVEEQARASRAHGMGV